MRGKFLQDQPCPALKTFGDTNADARDLLPVANLLVRYKRRFLSISQIFLTLRVINFLAKGFALDFLKNGSDAPTGKSNKCDDMYIRLDKISTWTDGRTDGRTDTNGKTRSRSAC